MEKYKYNGILSTIRNLSPTIKEAKFFYGDDDEKGKRIIDNLQGQWGDIFPITIVPSEDLPMPQKLKLRWINIVDLKCYQLTADIESEKMQEMWEENEKQSPNAPFKYIVVGIGPYGEVVLWLRSNEKAVLFQQYQAKEVEYNEKERKVYSEMDSDEDVMQSIITKEEFAGLMKQYDYRYVVLEEYFNGKKWIPYANDDDFYENINIAYLEDKREDGTFDFTDGDNLFKCHIAGMPNRITVSWNEGETNYFAHFWLNTRCVTLFFEALQKNFPGLPADILIRLDTRANRYEVAMTAEDLVTRTFIGTEYIVFKDSNEVCRSEEYYREDQEWEW